MRIMTDEERAAWAEAIPDDTPFHRTDAGNGEHFARLYGDRVRYDHRRRRWLIWAGHWWRDDGIESVRRLAKEAARDRYGQALSISNLKERKRESGFAIASENRQRVEAMLLAARSEPPIADAGDRWDVDPWLLGVANGVLDLRSGVLRPGVPDDRVTQSVDVDYDPDATCPRWEVFLEEVFAGDAEVIDFIWRAVGYSLTGDITEQCVFTCWGVGSNGKSVFLATLRALAGHYGTNTPFSTLELSGRPSIPNDLAALAGRRLVTASETNEGARLNEARLKALTGGDPITARFLHGEFFTYQPVLKLWLAVNHKPIVRDDSHGFWRRVRLIPFTRRFDRDADPALADRLRAELAGILAWAIRGALLWREEGLRIPSAVTLATEAYRAESDPLADFLADRCVEGEGLVLPTTPAYRAYRDWATGAGLTGRELLTHKAFGSRMSERYPVKHRKDGNAYLGVGLATRGSDPAPPPAG
jgi:putative DNA primase/helicase